MFIKTIFNESKKVKSIRNYVSKLSLYLRFLIQQNLVIFGEKMLISAELKGCATWFIYFLVLLWVRYNCAKFIIAGYVWQILGRGTFFAPPSPPYPWAAPRRSTRNRVNRNLTQRCSLKKHIARFMIKSLKNTCKNVNLMKNYKLTVPMIL